MPFKRGLSLFRVAFPGLGGPFFGRGGSPATGVPAHPTAGGSVNGRDDAGDRPRLFLSLARPLVPWFPLMADAVFFLSAMCGLVVLSVLVMRVWFPQYLLGPLPLEFAAPAMLLGPIAILLGFVALPVIYAKHRPPLGITRITYSFIARMPVLLLGLAVVLGPLCWVLMAKPIVDPGFLSRLLLTGSLAIGAWLVSHWTCRKIEFRLLFDDSDYIGLCHDCGCAVLGPKATKDRCPECRSRLAKLD